MAVGQDGNVRGLLTSQLKPTEEGLLAGGMLKRPTLENSEQSESYLDGVSQAWTLYEYGQYTGDKSGDLFRQLLAYVPRAKWFFAQEMSCKYQTVESKVAEILHQ